MKELDGRKLAHATLEEIRIRAVKQVQSGESPEIGIKALGLHRSNIYNWLSLYREGGFDALKSKKAAGPEPKLKGADLKKLYDIITLNNPLNLKFEFALWTRSMVRELIKDKFNVRLSDVSVGRLLHKLGLSPQRPIRKAFQRDDALVRRFQEIAYPEIKKLAKKEKATIYFGDEASIRSNYHSGTTWSPIGKTPVVKTTGARFGINMISAVSRQGTLRFMTFDGSMNADKFIEFLQRLIYRAEKPIFLVLDGHAVHKSKKVTKFVEGSKGKLRIFILPPYSPHLNPDEWVWNWLKNHNLGKTRVSTAQEFRKTVNHFMKRLQKLPQIIINFFKDKNLSYIF